MSVEVTKHAGFCMGVKRAVEISLNTAKQQKSCYTLGELIHNPQVVSWLASKGVKPAKNLDDISSGETVIIRSHGVAPEVMEACKQKQLHIIDCTCPFVEKLHMEVNAYAKQGYQVVLVGSKDHPEVIGTIGYAGKQEVLVISTVKEAEEKTFSNKVLLVAQTTFPVDLWEEIVQTLQQRLLEDLVVKNTICLATAQRQQEAKELAAKVDAMIVVGGHNSANTLKLWEACKKLCPNTIMVECAAEIPPDFANTYNAKIGITAGASTPDWSLKEVVTNMMDRGNLNNTDPIVTPAQEETPVDASQETPAEEVVEVTQEAVEEQAVESNEETLQEDQPAKAQEVEAIQEDTYVQEEQEESAQDKAASDFMAGIEATMVKIRRGQTVVGTVVQITDDEVCVNIGYKSDGLISKGELENKDVEVGDEIEVEVVKLNDGDGNVILSQRNIVSRKAWDALMEKHENNEYVEGIGKEAVKGGLLADVGGVRAFVPASLLAQRYVDKISEFVGKTMELKIIEVDSQKKRIVASRRAVLDEQRQEKKKAAWERLIEGQVVKGIVRRLTDFGAFVDLDGVDGLIHITDLSWARINHPSDIVSPNQEIEVEILSLDPERERIQLGYKQLQPHPWDNVEEKYPEGSIQKGKVVRITTFGAFVELEPGVDGLVHISQLAPIRVKKVEDVVSVDQIVDVKILRVDPQAKRISLSISEAMADLGIPFDYPEDDYQEDAYYENENTETFENAEVAEETVAEDAVIEEAVAEEAVAEEAVVEDAVIEEAVAEDAVIEEAVVEEDIIEETENNDEN
ncbi:MAG: bifunctional 4-hydroxy-3-methylbut-2-enyl diphosphate reductase/30S ribosomal protein S1 [Clostridiales bacterium]|nr:bifunctional 4-hydroxy-3-methylbut-2-enyl diphosphate reductase/30S ribosomal protein S1 [Clostridiales bacterium]